MGSSICYDVAYQRRRYPVINIVREAVAIEKWKGQTPLLNIE